jgi:hypothetical protein
MVRGLAARRKAAKPGKRSCWQRQRDQLGLPQGGEGMPEAVALSCLAIDVVDGYPVLRKVFRHLRRTPRKFWLYVELAPGTRYVVSSSANFRHVGDSDVCVASPAGDFVQIPVPPGFEGGFRVDILDAATTSVLASRRVHFGGA